MRAVLLALLLVGPAAAQAPGKPERVTFSRAELEQLQKELEAMVREREKAAFQAGRADARARCASLI